jgi:hypothetical protein
MAKAQGSILEFDIQAGEICLFAWGMSAGRIHVFSRDSIVLGCCSYVSHRSDLVVNSTSHSCVHLGCGCRMLFTTMLHKLFEEGDNLRQKSEIQT